MSKDLANINAKLEAAKAAAAKIHPQAFSTAKLIYEYKTHISTEVFRILRDFGDIKKEDTSAIKSTLQNIDDIPVSSADVHPLLKNIFECGKKLIKNFDKKYPQFFQDKEKNSTTDYTSTTNFVSTILKQELISNLEKVEKQYKTHLTTEELSQIQDQKGGISSILSSTSSSPVVHRGDSPMREQEDILEKLGLTQEVLITLDPKEQQDIIEKGKAFLDSCSKSGLEVAVIKKQRTERNPSTAPAPGRAATDLNRLNSQNSNFSIKS